MGALVKEAHGAPALAPGRGRVTIPLHSPHRPSDAEAARKPSASLPLLSTMRIQALPSSASRVKQGRRGGHILASTKVFKGGYQACTKSARRACIC